MSILQSIRLPAVKNDDTKLSNIFLFNNKYLILSKNLHRNVYITTTENYIQHCSDNADPTDQPCWQIFEPAEFQPGEQLIRANAHKNNLYVRPFSPAVFTNLFEPEKTPYCANLLGYFLELTELGFVRQSVFFGANRYTSAQFGELKATNLNQGYYVSLYLNYGSDKISIIIDNRNLPRFERKLDIYRFNIQLLQTQTLLNGPDEVKFYPDSSEFKIKYFPEQNAVVILFIMSNHITQGLYYNLITEQSELRRFIDISDTSGLLLDGSLVNFITNQTTTYPEITNDHDGTWWIPLGFATGNRTYWLQFNYTPEYIQPAKIKLMPEGREWIIPSVITKIMIEKGQIRETFIQAMNRKQSESHWSYDLVFHTLFGREFWDWSTYDNMERLILWSEKSIIFVHPRSEQVWISPVFENNFTINVGLRMTKEQRAVEATDDGLILVTSPEYKIFHASLL